MLITKNGLKILKGFHLTFVSLTLGGIGLLIVLFLIKRSSHSETEQLSVDLLIFRIFEWVMNYSIGGLLLTGFIYGMFTHWGFFKYFWILVKWLLVFTIFILAIVWGFSNINGLAALADIGIGRMDTLAYKTYQNNSLFFISLLIFILICIVFLSTLRPWGKIRNWGIKRRGWVLTIAGITALFVFYYMIGSNVFLERFRNMSVDPAQLNFLEDGIYGGKFNEAGGPYRVKVKIQNHKITEIKSIQNRESHYVKLAEGIFYKVKDSQQIDLDGISGATTTSKCFLKAIENALSDPENLRQ